jgi:hypothetical protein
LNGKSRGRARVRARARVAHWAERRDLILCDGFEKGLVIVRGGGLEIELSMHVERGLQRSQSRVSSGPEPEPEPAPGF